MDDPAEASILGGVTADLSQQPLRRHRIEFIPLACAGWETTPEKVVAELDRIAAEGWELVTYHIAQGSIEPGRTGKVLMPGIEVRPMPAQVMHTVWRRAKVML